MEGTKNNILWRGGKNAGVTVAQAAAGDGLAVGVNVEGLSGTIFHDLPRWEVEHLVQVLDEWVNPNRVTLVDLDQLIQIFHHTDRMTFLNAKWTHLTGVWYAEYSFQGGKYVGYLHQQDDQGNILLDPILIFSEKPRCGDPVYATIIQEDGNTFGGLLMIIYAVQEEPGNVMLLDPLTEVVFISNWDFLISAEEWAKVDHGQG